jgi:hypothetical protein
VPARAKALAKLTSAPVEPAKQIVTINKVLEFLAKCRFATADWSLTRGRGMI